MTELVGWLAGLVDWNTGHRVARGKMHSVESPFGVYEVHPFSRNRVQSLRSGSSSATAIILCRFWGGMVG